MYGDSVSYTSPTYAAYQENHANDTTADHMLVYKLSAPYTVTMIPPTVDIAFGTQTAISGYDSGTNNCNIWAEEPVVVITIR